MSRRQDAATATVGAGLTATGGFLRHAGVQELIHAQGGKEPKVHGLAIARHGTPLSRKLYTAGAVSGLIGAPALGIGGTRFVRRKNVVKRDNDSFLQEGIKGTGQALAERKDTIAQRNVPTKARVAGLATTAGAGSVGVLAARGLLRHKGGGTKALISPVAGVLAGAAATPLSSRAVNRVSPGYEVTPSGVKRKRKVPKRASSASYQHRAVPRSFQADIAKDASTRRYRAKVTAAGSVPIPGVNWAAQARTAGALAPTGQKRQAEGTQFAGSAGGDVAGFLGGAHGAGYLAEHHAGFKRGAEAANAHVENVRSHLPKLPTPKISMPAGASAGRAGRVVRAAVRPLKNPKTAAAAAVGGLAGQAVLGNTLQQAAMTRNIHQGRVKKLDTGMTPKEQQKQLKRRARLIAVNTMGATTGAAGLAAFAASRHPHFHTHKPALEAATLGLGAVGGGIGSYGGFKRAKVEHRDLRAQRKALGVAKSMPDQSALSVPTGLLKTKTYAASSVRTTPTGKLVRTKAGVR